MIVVALVFFLACMVVLWRMWEGDLVAMGIVVAFTLLAGLAGYLVDA